jgi:hypothetical protein
VTVTAGTPRRILPCRLMMRAWTSSSILN